VTGWRKLATAAGAAAALALQVLAVSRQALTSDEAYHLLAGYQADRYGQNGLNLEHPPLVKLLAALPLLGLRRALSPPVRVDTALSALQILYQRPDAEARGRLGGRALLAALFGLPLLGAAFLLGREVGGGRAGFALALLLGLDWSVFPQLGLVYTDTAAALGFTLTLLAAARFLRRPRLPAAAGMGLGLGLALASKLTGLLALPVIAGALLLAPRLPQPAESSPGTPGRPFREAGRRLLFGLLAGAIAVAGMEAVYAAANRHYDPASGRQTIELYCADHSTMRVEDRLQPFASWLLAVERHDPRAAQWLTGLVATRAQNALATYPACNFGRMHSRGLWWYFPVLLVARTPLPLLLACGAAPISALIARRRRRGAPPAVTTPAAMDTLPGAADALPTAPEASPAAAASPPNARDAITAAPQASGTGAATGSPGVVDTMAATSARAHRRLVLLLAGTAAIYLAVAMTSNYNAGLRHLLPVLPILYLPAALWLGRRPRLGGLVAAALLAEALALAPAWLTADSAWWLGEHDPLRFALFNDNCYYPQNLIALREARDRRDLRPLYVIDPVLGAPQVDLYLGAGTSRPPEAPLVAGWYAVGSAEEVCLPAILKAVPAELYSYPRYHALAERWQPAAAAVARSGQDQGWVGGSFHLYRVGRAGGAPAAPATGLAR
jgi:hypothetical protein